MRNEDLKKQGSEEQGPKKQGPQERNPKKKGLKKGHVIAYLFCVLAIVGGFQVLIFGEIGAPTGAGMYQFDGFERLVALWPMCIALFIMWGTWLDHTGSGQDDADDENSKTSEPDDRV